MQERIFKVAAQVISEADKEHPADDVLRWKLKEERGLPREAGRAIARAVFDYYRWFGWLDPSKSPEKQLLQASDLAENFHRKPDLVSDQDLAVKAVPNWAASMMKVSPRWLRAIQREPLLWLRSRPNVSQHLAADLGDCRVVDGLPDALVYEGTEDLFQRREFHAGEFEMQDLSSQAVGWICLPQPGQTWWDACAGQGGKTLHLADQMKNKGLIWATDRAEWRLQKLKRRAARARIFNYRAAVWDGGKKLPTKTRFDGVLVDAPCSGIGTWQRNPQARWTTEAADVQELAAIQSELLANVASSVKPGGKLVYSVCTLATIETIGVANAFTQAFKEFKPLPFNNPLTQDALAKPELWVWPQHYSANGMFIAVWRREL